MGHLLTLLQPKKIILQASFNQPDSTIAIGNANTGQACIADQGTWGISNNQAYQVTAISAGAAIWDVGTPNCILRYTYSNYVATQRCVCRYVDSNNHIKLSQVSSAGYHLIKRIGGVETTLGSYGSDPVTGDRVVISLNGNTIKVFVNGIERISVSESFNNDKTMHGISTNNSACRFDDLIVEAL